MNALYIKAEFSILDYASAPISLLQKKKKVNSCNSISMNRWIGRIGVVTGASTGIGAAICKELVKKGMKVVGCSRRIQKIEEMAKSEELSNYGGRLYPWRCDMAIESDVLALYDYIRTKLGSIDVCVNNAMININSSLLSGKTEDWRQMIEVGIEGMCLSTREALKLMKENYVGDGHIIQMGSIVGHKIPQVRELPGSAPPPACQIYNGVKFMNRALVESLRQELMTENCPIRVSTISPGAVETDILFGILPHSAVIQFFKYYKCLEPADVADAVNYILETPPHVRIGDIILEPRAFTV